MRRIAATGLALTGVGLAVLTGCTASHESDPWNDSQAIEALGTDTAPVDGPTSTPRPTTENSNDFPVTDCEIVVNPDSSHGGWELGNRTVIVNAYAAKAVKAEVVIDFTDGKPKNAVAMTQTNANEGFPYVQEHVGVSHQYKPVGALVVYATKATVTVEGYPHQDISCSTEVQIGGVAQPTPLPGGGNARPAPTEVPTITVAPNTTSFAPTPAAS